MADPYTAPVPARFFTLPDGTQSSVQVNPSTGGPLEVKTAQQFSDWNAIQDAKPPTAVEQQTRLNALAARPLTPAAAEADKVTGVNLLDDMRFAAEAEAGTSAVTGLPAAPRTRAEHDQRALAAAQLAASLGLELVHVRDDTVMKVPAHLELRQAGMTYMAGDLGTLETALRTMARERARSDVQIAAWQADRDRKEREQAEEIAALPANRLARLEAALAAQGIAVEA